VLTVLRGKIVAENGRITGSPEDGQFLKRGISPFATPSRIARSFPHCCKHRQPYLQRHIFKQVQYLMPILQEYRLRV
jgi:hypothetical protein